MSEHSDQHPRLIGLKIRTGGMQRRQSVLELFNVVFVISSTMNEIDNLDIALFANIGDVKEVVYFFPAEQFRLPAERAAAFARQRRDNPGSFSAIFLMFGAAAYSIQFAAACREL